MIKWFVYIVFLLVFTPYVLAAKAKKGRRDLAISTRTYKIAEITEIVLPIDTPKTLKSIARQDNKVKEVAKARKQPKPEKVDDDSPPKEKPKREKRPDGMQRPPEIPRRNDN